MHQSNNYKWLTKLGSPRQEQWREDWSQLLFQEKLSGVVSHIIPSNNTFFQGRKKNRKKTTMDLTASRGVWTDLVICAAPKSEEILWEVSFYNQSSIKYLFPFLVLLNHSCFLTQMLWKILPHCQIRHWVVNYIFLLHISSIRFHFHCVILLGMYRSNFRRLRSVA